MVKLETAAQCPKCNKLGTAVKVDKHPRFDVVVYNCMNPVCPWYRTGWVVQSDRQGVVMERDRGERGMDKDFEPLSKEALERGRARIEEITGRNMEDDA